jgi:hypothetical protein
MGKLSSRLTHSLPEPAFTDDCQLEPRCEFDYDAIEAGPIFRLEDLEGLNRSTARGIEAGQQVIRSLITWIWQDGMQDARGIQIRSIIVCWVFLPHLHPLTMTELARGFGKDKQSLGRWVDDFKLKFPTLRNAHMQ